MSTVDIRRQRADVEARAVIAEREISNQHGNHGKLEAAISAAELYMQALRLSDNPEDRKRLDVKTKQLISKAEEFKRKNDGSQIQSQPKLSYPVSKRKLTTRENIILLESSKLNGTVFKPWTAPPSNKDFELGDDQGLFVDDFEYSLSETQLKHFAGWKRAKDALSSIKVEKNGQLLPNEATMLTLGTWDMVQDAAPDCSVIASLCVGTARAQKGHRKVSVPMSSPIPCR